MIRQWLQKRWARIKGGRVIRLDPEVSCRGTVAISYLTWPFAEGWDSPKARGHTNAYEVVAMAHIYRELGLRVEIADHTDPFFRPPPDCRIAIDIHSNLERWDPMLPDGCRRILHATGPHWLTQNQAELGRLASLRDRKGVALRPRRQVEPSRAVEVADRAVVLGNDYTIETFLFADKPVRRIPISSAYDFEFPAGRNFAEAKRRFLWLGSYGMVHKGLDLVLDAFSGVPGLQLTVCGRPEKEEDFFRLYKRELGKCPNIRLHGWVDMGSAEFAEICRTHASVIYPSSAEGGGGSVIHCMHAGLVPICTREASVDCGDFGISIRRGDVESVRAAALEFADLPAAEVESRAVAAREHARKVHTREQFTANYRRFAEDLAGELRS